MKILSLVVMAAVAATGLVSVASAAECKVIVVSGPPPKSPVQIACPSLYLRGNSTINLVRPETVTDEALKNISPCKETTCLTALQNGRPENCTSDGYNWLVVHDSYTKLCEALNAGPVSVADATAILQPAFETAKAWEAMASNGTSADMSPVVTTPTPAETKATTLPTPTPKSGASGAVVVATTAVVWTATAIHWLA